MVSKSTLCLILIVIISDIKLTTQLEYAGYDEPCSDNRILCNPKKFLECGHYNKCECKGDSVHIPRTEGCRPLPQASNNWNCDIDGQCHESGLGPHSKCDRNHCECLREIIDEEKDWVKDVVRHDDNCRVVNYKGEPCSIDADCETSRNFKCIGPQSGSPGQCGCEEESHWYHYDVSTDSHNCLDSNRALTCRSDVECREAHGKLSVCDGRAQTCKCSALDASGVKETGFYKGRCYLKKIVGDACDHDEECIIGGTVTSRCDQETKTCRSTAMLNSSVSVFIIAISMAVIFTISFQNYA